MGRNDGKISQKHNAAFLKWLCRIVWVAAVLVVSGLISIRATAVIPIDFTKDGNSSIQITLETLTDARPVENAEFIMYQLQKLDQQNGFVWNPEYMACDIEIDGLSSSQLAAAAAGIADYSIAHHIAGITQTTDENGFAAFTGLELGMYLIVWNNGPQDIEPARPFLVSVPMEDTNGWVYDIPVRPKVDEIPEAPVSPDDPHQPEEPHQPDKPKTSGETPSEEISTIEVPSEEISTEAETQPDDTTTDVDEKLPQTGPNRWLTFLVAIVGFVTLGIGIKRIYFPKVLISIGAVCMLFAGGSIGYGYYREQLAAEQTDHILAEYERRYSDETQESDTADGTKGIEIDGVLYGGILSIPSLGIVLPVDMELSDEKLKNTPCLYMKDEQQNTMIIAAHNYARHFGGLSQLEEGAEVIYVDSQGTEYHYTVSETEILGAYDVDKMKEGDWNLTLFTCTYGGRSRVTVRCRSVH